MKKNYKQSCENYLKKFANKKYCLLLGRAATALFLAYRALSKKKKIIIPNVMCLSPFYASLYANRDVILCDINLKDGTYSEIDLFNIVKNNKNNISAILFVHLFGSNSLKNKYYNLCKENNITIIEDAAQAFGGEFQDGSKFGSKGDISIFSFGKTKNVNAGYGGAILTDNINFFSTIKKNFIDLPKFKDLSSLYKKFYYLILELEKKNLNVVQIRNILPFLFKRMYFRKADNSQAKIIYNKLINYKKEILINKKNFDIYFKNLKNIKGIRILQNSNILSPWRFSFLIRKDKRNSLLEKIRYKNYDVSSWYPSLHKIAAKKGKFKNSGNFEKRIVNLWIDGTYNKKKIVNICKIIKNHLH